MSSKTCTTCLTEKLTSDFYKKLGGKYGVRSTCKVCDKLSVKTYYVNNKETRVN
jgi:hypothetical protein